MQRSNFPHARELPSQSDEGEWNPSVAKAFDMAFQMIWKYVKLDSASLSWTWTSAWYERFMFDLSKSPSKGKQLQLCVPSRDDHHKSSHVSQWAQGKLL